MGAKWYNISNKAEDKKNEKSFIIFASFSVYVSSNLAELIFFYKGFWA